VTENDKNPQLERWNNLAFGLGALCLLFIAFTEALGLSTATLRNVLIGGVFVAGTIMWLVQARKHCPHCGQMFGYHFRILRGNQCRKCGGDIRG